MPLFERPLILRLNLPFAYQQREARRIETNLLWKHQAAVPSLTRRAVCHHDKPHADSVGFQKSDARERWPSAAARDQHPSWTEKEYLGNMLSRRQLQGFVGCVLASQSDLSPNLLGCD